MSYSITKEEFYKALGDIDEILSLERINTVDETDSTIKDEDGYTLPEDPAYDKAEDIKSKIDDIILNTLSKDGTISLESSQTLLNLQQLQRNY